MAEGGRGMYLDVEVLVDLEHFAEHENELHHGSKLPHITYAGNERRRRRLLGGRRRLLELGASAFPRHGGKGGRSVRTGRGKMNMDGQ